MDQRGFGSMGLFSLKDTTHTFLTLKKVLALLQDGLLTRKPLKVKCDLFIYSPHQMIRQFREKGWTYIWRGYQDTTLLEHKKPQPSTLYKFNNNNLNHEGEEESHMRGSQDMVESWVHYLGAPRRENQSHTQFNFNTKG